MQGIPCDLPRLQPPPFHPPACEPLCSHLNAPKPDYSNPITTLQAHFARTSPVKTPAQQAAQVAQLRAKLPAGAAAPDDRLLVAATSLNMVESIALLPNLPVHGFVGVNMYVDDEGSIREAPFNARASELATLCGKPLQVRGDAFLSRVLDDGEAFRRLDFGANDLSSSAPWVATARAKNAEARRGEGAQAILQRMQAEGAGPGPASSPSPADALKQQGNAGVCGGGDGVGGV